MYKDIARKEGLELEVENQEIIIKGKVARLSVSLKHGVVDSITIDDVNILGGDRPFSYLEDYENDIRAFRKVLKSI